jgi:hypothetical protein
MSQHLESYYNKVDVRNPIITKHNVWSPIIANFSQRAASTSSKLQPAPAPPSFHLCYSGGCLHHALTPASSFLTVSGGAAAESIASDRSRTNIAICDAPVPAPPNRLSSIARAGGATPAPPPVLLEIDESIVPNPTPNPRTTKLVGGRRRRRPCSRTTHAAKVDGENRALSLPKTPECSLDFPIRKEERKTHTPFATVQIQNYSDKVN